MSLPSSLCVCEREMKKKKKDNRKEKPALSPGNPPVHKCLNRKFYFCPFCIVSAGTRKAFKSSQAASGLAPNCARSPLRPPPTHPHHPQLLYHVVGQCAIVHFWHAHQQINDTKIVILPQGVSFKEIAISERNQVKSDSLAIDNIHPSIDGIYIKYSRQPKILQFHK